MTDGSTPLEFIDRHGQPPSGTPEDPPSDDQGTISPTDSSRHSEDQGQSEHDGNAQETRDLETLSHVSSGPAYTVFTPSMRWWIVAMNCVSAFISPTTANIYFPALPSIASDLGVSIAAANLSLTTYMIFQALAPTVFGDLGDAAGRRPAFIISMTINLGANIGLALQRNYAALLVLRMLQSAGSSATIALVYAVVADISTTADRGKFMGIVGAGITIGPAVGPIIGGLLTEYLGWPSIFWFLMIVGVVWMIPYVLAVPETCRKIVGNGSIPPQGWNMTLLDYLRFRRQHHDRSAIQHKTKIPVPNPLHTIAVLRYKDLAILLVFNGLLYIGFMVATATLSSQLSDIYHYSELILGLCYIPIGVACSISSISQGLILDWNYRRTAKKIGFKIDRKHGDDLKDFPIEKVRLQLIGPMLAVGTIAYIGYAWALQAQAHIAVVLVMTFFIGLCVTGSFQIINVLIVDLYSQAPATATAANNFVRCLCGAVATAVVQYIIDGIGRGWTFTLIALIFAVPSPALLIIAKNGPKYREQRRQKLLREKEEREARHRKKMAERAESHQVVEEKSTDTQH